MYNWSTQLLDLVLHRHFVFPILLLDLSWCFPYPWIVWVVSSITLVQIRQLSLSVNLSHCVVSTAPFTFKINSRFPAIIFHSFLEPPFTRWISSSDSVAIAIRLSLSSHSVLILNVTHNLVEPSVLIIEHNMRSFFELFGDFFGQLMFHAAILTIVPLLIPVSNNATFLLKFTLTVLRIPSTHNVFSFQCHTNDSTSQHQY